MNRQEENRNILELIQEYNDTYPDQRFGQILFNLGINQFASPENPEIKNFLCRDIFQDSSSAILTRVKKHFLER